MTSLFRCLAVLSVLAALGKAAADAQEVAEQSRSTIPAAVERPIDFVADVQPILREHCFECHSGEVEEGDLNLAIRAKAMKGGENGVVIVAGDSASSVLVRLVSGGDEDRQMPPEDRLSPDQIGVLRAWIDQGAGWPEGTDVLDPRVENARDHWAFQPLKAIQPPAKRRDDTWTQTVIDRFIDEKLQRSKLSPSPAAAAKTLVRRLYFDLTGLPPTRAQIAEFVQQHPSASQAAIKKLAGALLDSEAYGERWARHWLDVARYADSDGQEADQDRPHAYHYRDFVIKALNDDMPYDQFVRWQIAGDEYEPDNDLAVSATGFLTAGPSFKLKDSFLERERLFNRYNELDNIISTLGEGFLGITMGCARCHDHKYDAFSSREYYQLLCAFHSGDRKDAKLPSGKDGFFFQDFDTAARTTWLFRRSDFYDREIEVPLGFPSILSRAKGAGAYWSAAKASVASPQSTLQRRALADWMTDSEQGAGALLARVFVNRVWQLHFGQGLVRTPSDFGVRGQRPTHPQLLEYLAEDFVSGGWKIKRLHRKILTSAVWQQRSGLRKSVDSSAEPTSAADPNEIDPQNLLLWKMTPRRLEAEALRDAMLAVSGTLNREAGGPGFKPYIPPEANFARNLQGAAYPQDAKDDASTRRRSVYMFHKRLIPYPLFQAFDRPELMVSCAQRQNTTVAPQAMAILNDRFVRAVAGDFASRLLQSNGDDDQGLVSESFELSFARLPTPFEMEASVAFINSQRTTRQARNERSSRREAVTDYCQSLFGLNEFIYID